MFKSTLLLTTALFLITAPAPDAADIAEATHGLMADNGAVTLQAAEKPASCPEPAQPAPGKAAAATDACPAKGHTP